MIKSFLSFAFLRPANAIFVPLRAISKRHPHDTDPMDSRDILLRVLKVLHQSHQHAIITSFLRSRPTSNSVSFPYLPSAIFHLEGGKGKAYPFDPLVDVGLGVRITFDLTGMTAEETVQVWADFVGLACA